MKPRVFLRLILLAVLLAACAPAKPGTAPAQPVEIEPTLNVPPPTATVEAPLQATLAPQETLAPTPLAVVTSRGPHLEATDPTTVNMASGGLQLVEFFEFW
jgi:hypothetical protein